MRKDHTKTSSRGVYITLIRHPKSFISVFYGKYLHAHRDRMGEVNIYEGMYYSDFAVNTVK